VTIEYTKLNLVENFSSINYHDDDILDICKTCKNLVYMDELIKHIKCRSQGPVQFRKFFEMKVKCMNKPRGIRYD